MNDATSGSPWRCLLTWLAATAAAAALLAWAAPDLAARPPTAPFDAWLTWLCAVAAALCAVWAWLVTSVVVLEALSRRPRRASTPGVPAWVRNLVLGACGVAVLGATSPAVAGAHHEREHRERHSVLEGLPLPDRAEGRSVTELVAQTIARTTTAEQSARYVVRPGDSLWSIAHAHLGDPTRWPRIYALNRDEVGPDPDLIQPGQQLRLPELHGEDVR